MRFSDNHPVACARRARKPSPGQVLRELDGRIAWLSRKVDAWEAKYGERQTADKNPHLRELLALLRAREIVEVHRCQRTQPEETRV